MSSSSDESLLEEGSRLFLFLFLLFFASFSFTGDSDLDDDVKVDDEEDFSAEELLGLAFILQRSKA